MSISNTVSRKARSAREFARGLLDTAHPLLVQIIPIRRCNIDCGYCNEYDKVSPPVATDVMMRRIDKLAELGTSVVAFSGGEPMLHPDLDALIRHIRGRGMMAGLITNGYFLVPKRIRGAERGGTRLPADQHRQHRARRGVEEEPAGARQKAAEPEGPRRLRRQHQLRARRRHQECRRRADHQSTGARPRLFHVHRHHSRRRRTPEASRPERTRRLRRSVRGNQRAVAGVQESLLGDHQLPGEAGRRPTERVAVPRRRTVPLHLRGRPGPLLLAAARLARRPARVVHVSTTSAASFSRPNGARRTARSAASTGFRRWTSGAAHRKSRDTSRSPATVSLRRHVNRRFSA